MQNILSVTDWQAYEWNDVSEEVIDSKILAFFSLKNLTFIFAITGVDV